MPLLGHLLPFRRDVLGLLTESRARCGDVVRFRLGPMVVHLVAHPDAIRHVLQERADLYDKETRSSSKIRGMTGLGLLTASGALWHRQRRLVQPGFRSSAVAGFAARMVEATEAMLARWERQAASAAPLDIASEMMRLTYSIVGRTLFSADVSGDTDAVEEAMGVVRERDEETGEGMADRQLRNETITLLLAGHETTANALAWTLYLLARHPEALERVHAEVEAVLGDRAPVAEDLKALPFTERVICESLRLYPPIWALERRASVADEIDGFHIPAGSTVVVSPWVTHRHPDLWEEPERFDPDRFTEERSEGRPLLAHVPFGAGPRFCVGAHFAMTEAMIITALVVRRLRLRLVPGRPVIPLPGITLRARDGVWMTLDWRRSKGLS